MTFIGAFDKMDIQFIGKSKDIGDQMELYYDRIKMVVPIDWRTN